MAAMATSTNAAEKAAGLTEIGGLAGCEPAWRGEGGPEDKQRLKGSIVLLKSGKFAYLPVSSSSSAVKVFQARHGGDVGPWQERRLLRRQGGESGQGQDGGVSSIGAAAAQLD